MAAASDLGQAGVPITCQWALPLTSPRTTEQQQHACSGLLPQCHALTEMKGKKDQLLRYIEQAQILW